MIDNDFSREQNFTFTDRFVPQVKLYNKSFSQKDLSDSGSLSSEIIDNFKEGISYQQINNSSKQTVQPKPKTFKFGMNYQQYQFKKMLISSNYIKKVAQKLIDLSQILQNGFKNTDLLQEQYLSEKQQKNLDQNAKQEIIYIPVIHLNHLILKIWELIKLIVCVVLMWWMPFKEAFVKNKTVDIEDYVLLYFIILDIILQLNKEIIVKGQLIKTRQLIIKYYVKNQLAFDILYLLFYCCIIFDLLSYSMSQILNIIFFFFNLRKFQQVIQNYQESSISINDKINLVELILTVLVLAHFMACIWFLVGITSLDYHDESWILKLNLQNEQVLTQYCYSFYWAATTMVTVGYGDITAQNLNEVICSSILIFFSSGIFAFTLNSIGVILNNINQSQSFYKRSLLLINQHMDSNEVSNNLQNKIRNFLKFYYQSSHSSHEKDVEVVVEQLSQNLREELINDIRSKVVTNNFFLKNYFSKQTQLSLIQNLQQINFTPHEQIYEQLAADDHSFYIIQKGQVQIADKNSGRIIQKLNQGDSFGEIELLTENLRYSQAYSVGFTKLLKITRSQFISIIKQDQRDFQQFHMLKDQILLKLKSPSFCRVCHKNHLIYDCNKLFYKPNLERILKQELFHSNQERQDFQRFKKLTFNLSDANQIQQRCQVFRQDNEMEDQNECVVTNPSLSSRHNSIHNANSSLSQLRNFQDKPSDQSVQLTKNNNNDSLLQKLYENIRENKRFFPQKQQYSRKLSTKSQRKSQNYITYQPSKGQSVSNMKSEEQFIELDIDKPQNYRTYFAQNNMTSVILQYEKYLKKTLKEKCYTIPSNYRFYQLQKQKVLSARHKLK